MRDDAYRRPERSQGAETRLGLPREALPDAHPGDRGKTEREQDAEQESAARIASLARSEHMMSSRWATLGDLGQSVWYDNVARPALVGGRLEALVREDGVTGGTYNPSIFSRAVLVSELFDDDIRDAGKFYSDE